MQLRLLLYKQEAKEMMYSTLLGKLVDEFLSHSCMYVANTCKIKLAMVWMEVHRQKTQIF